MSGKQRQAQRTKNNARPSSSSRSAEKLGTNLPAFIGFSADRDGGYVSVLPGFSSNENIDSNLDPNIQVVFRKMCKKDPTTKLKALNEFNSIINFSDEPTVCTTLSFWPKLYSQLSLDCNHRVREAAQIAHFSLVGKCGRSIAPYLKQIIPVWIASQFDIYMPAKTQAKEAFDKMFPLNKVPEVMTFCRKEILNFIIDNLIKHTSVTLSNPKIFTQDECDSIYERTLVMSLQAYELFLNNIPEEHLEWLCENQSNLLESNKFWDLGKHKSSTVRSSFFGVIGCLCRIVKDWFNPKYGKKAATLVFTKLAEKEVDVVGAVLENSILLMANLPNWWETVDSQSKILTNILLLLSEGGYNNATRIGPLLAPLLIQLSNIPNKEDEFYNNFFNSICKGLERRCVFSSKVGYDAWLSGLVECLKHFAIVNSKSDQGAQLLSQPIRYWISAVMSPRISNSSFNYKKLCTSHLANVSISWSKESMSNDPDKNIFYSHLSRLFWNNVLFIISSQIDDMKPEEEEIKKVTDIHIDILSGLKHFHAVNKKKSTGVKFSIDQTDQIGNEIAEKKDNADVDLSVKNYQHGLNNLVYDTCGKYLYYAKKNNLSSPVLTPLFTLVSEFDAPRLHEAMYYAVNSKDRSAYKTLDLYTDCYAGWLRGDSMRSPIVVDLIFVLLGHLNYDEQSSVLKSFDMLPLPVIKWCISRCIAHPYSSLPAVCDWLHSVTVHQSLTAISRLAVKEGDKNYLDLVKLCFMQSDSGEILIGQKTCIEIVNIFEQSLYDIESDHLNMCALFASYLLSIDDIVEFDDCKVYCDLLISMFTLDCNMQQTEDILPDDTLYEINSSWRDSLTSLSQENLVHFTEKVSIILHDNLLKSKNTVSKTDCLVNLTLNLVRSSLDAIEDTASDVLQKIMKSILCNKSENLETYISKMSTLSLFADILNGTFGHILVSDSILLKELVENQKDGDTDFDVQPIASWLLYIVKILDDLTPVFEEHIDKEGNQNEDLKREFKHVLIDIIYNFAIFKTLYSEYKMCNWFDLIDKYYKPIEDAIISTFNKLSKPVFDNVYTTLKQNAESSGLYWSKCIYICDFVLNRKTKTESEQELENNVVSTIQNLIAFQNLDDLFGRKFCHIIQLLIHETECNNSDDLKIKISGIVAMRHIFSKYSICGETSKLKLTIEDLVNVLSKPLGYLPIITDVHFLHKDLMLYDIDITNTDWSLIHCNSSIAKFLTICINQSGWDLKSEEWDFIMITISSLLNTLNLSKHSWKSYKVSTLSCAVFDLYYAVTRFMSSIIPESVRREPSEVIVHLLDEWRELFSPEIHKHVVEIFMAICSDCVLSSLKITSASIYFIDSLNRAMEGFDFKYLEKNAINVSTLSFLQKCLDVMESPNHHILKYMANNILKCLTPTLINGDKAEGDKSNNPNDVDLPIIPLVLSVHTIEPTLIQLQGCIEAVLAPYKVGLDNCVLLPFTDGHSIALGYLLIWEVMLDIAQESTAYLQHEYSEFFRKGEYVDKLLNVLFRLLPIELAEQSLLTTGTAQNYFKAPIKVSRNDPITMELISGLACHRLLRCLQGGWLGALVRNWWGSLPTRTSQFVEEIVRIYVSPVLIANQISGVVKNQSKLPNIEITIHNSVNEIVCLYAIEDLKMGLTIQMCNNHPLNKPSVVSSGTPLNNMAWLSMYLSHQNGSIYQAIKMWANAVQKKVESTPVCYVCYCRLHPTTGQLPKMGCQTCKNKFHSACMLRWFTTSGKKTCPMCRNVFSL